MSSMGVRILESGSLGCLDSLLRRWEEEEEEEEWVDVSI